MSEPSTMVPQDRLSRHYRRRVREMTSRFKDIRELIEHEGAKGIRVEKELRDFLTTYLPQVYEYASGIVVDPTGAELDRSRQEDVLVLDKFFNPRIFLDEEPSVYPVDVVYAGIEVKTSLDEAEIQAALKNVSSLKRLKYAKELVSVTRGNGMAVVQTTPPLGVIFAFDTPFRGIETVVRHLNEHASAIEVSERPDLICILNRGIFLFGRDNKAVSEVYGIVAKRGPETVIITTALPGSEVVHENEVYPVATIGGQRLPIDPARVFLAFLQKLSARLSEKVLQPFTNLLSRYLPGETGLHLRVAETGILPATK